MDVSIQEKLINEINPILILLFVPKRSGWHRCCTSWLGAGSAETKDTLNVSRIALQELKLHSFTEQPKEYFVFT